MAKQVYPGVFEPINNTGIMYPSWLWILKDQIFLSVSRVVTGARETQSALYLTTHVQNGHSEWSFMNEICNDYFNQVTK
jgi:hypothetical protein